MRPSHTLLPILLVDCCTGRPNFAILADAGSSGTRIQVYKWDHDRAIKSEFPFPNIKEVASFKVHRGLADLAEEENLRHAVEAYWSPLIIDAKRVAPKGTPFYIFATAGFRLLPPETQEGILAHSCSSIQAEAFFRVDGCRNHMKVISGDQEGIYGWLAVNYLLNALRPFHVTYGMVDMGGASQQIAFETGGKGADTTKVCLRNHGSGSIHIYHVFVRTFLGFGAQQARLRYLRRLIKDVDHSETVSRGGLGQTTAAVQETADADETQQSLSLHPSSVARLSDPCLPEGLEYTQDLSDLGIEMEPEGVVKTVELRGAGSFKRCYDSLVPMLDGSSFGALPYYPFGEERPFIGLSEYWYSSHDVFNLGGSRYSPERFYRVGQTLCGSPWWLHYQTQQRGKFPGGGRVDIQRVMHQCFKGAWMMAVLHEGFLMPWKRRNLEIPEPLRTFSKMKQLLHAKNEEDSYADTLEDTICPVDSLQACPVPKVRRFQSMLKLGVKEVSWTMGVALMIVMSQGSPVDMCPFTAEEMQEFGATRWQLFLQFIKREWDLITCRSIFALSLAGIFGIVVLWLICEKLSILRAKHVKGKKE